MFADIHTSFLRRAGLNSPLALPNPYLSGVRPAEADSRVLDHPLKTPGRRSAIVEHASP
jgi:hypothetical protein